MSALSTFSGIFLGLLILITAITLTAEDPGTFINIPGLIIVIGGTLAATLISYPITTISQAMHSVWYSLTKPQNHNLKSRINHYTDLMTSLKQGDLKKVEQNIHSIHSPYLESALQMVIDGDSLDDIMKVLNWRLETTKAHERKLADVFRSMGAYAPAFGMVGTLLGLVNMLTTMNEGGFDQIGVNMAVALITTFYGLLLANILFKPLALKLDQKTHEDVVMLNTAKEAVSLLAQGKSPGYAREILSRLMDNSPAAISD